MNHLKRIRTRSLPWILACSGCNQTTPMSHLLVMNPQKQPLGCIQGCAKLKNFPPSWQAFSIFALAKATHLPDKDAPLADCAVSSVVEHHLDTVGVTGSNPVSRTIFLGDVLH
jgi:hypothetical protein